MLESKEDGESILKVAGPFDACDVSIFNLEYTVWRILVYFILAANDWKIEKYKGPNTK